MGFCGPVSISRIKSIKKCEERDKNVIPEYDNIILIIPLAVTNAHKYLKCLPQRKLNYPSLWENCCSKLRLRGRLSRESYVSERF